MNYKILVIEDELEMREIIQSILERNGFNVITSQDGEAGIESAKKEIPDLILCDISMPIKNGFQVLTDIRQIESLKLIPFIFLTGKSDRNDVRKGMNLSADDYLTKPFRKNELLDAINTRLSRTQQIFNSQNLKLRELEENMDNFLQGKNSPKIQELESLVEKLKKAEIEKESQIKNYAFINSHLLRGPVANILGCLEIAKNNPEDYTETLKDIGKSTLELDEIIQGLNDLLNSNEQNEFNFRNSKISKIKTVFLVDDDEIQLKVTKQIISKNFPDVTVLTFNNANLAIKAIVEEFRPDKIFLDIFMPEMNGWQFIEELEKRNIDIDITMLSSSIDKEDIRKAKSYNSVTSYISKPITKEKIRKTFSD